MAHEVGHIAEYTLADRESSSASAAIGVMKKRRVDGEMFVFYIGWNGFGRMWIEGLRTDSLMIGSFRVSQLLGALMAAAAIVAFAVIRVRLKKAEAAGNAPTLWRDTEECRLKLEGKWDYKNNAPKEEEKKVGSEEHAEGTGAKTNSQEPENETDSGENSFGEQSKGELPMAVIIDGKEIAAKVREELKEKVDAMVNSEKRRPCLAVILVGEDPASKIYVRNKQRACAEVGIAQELYTLAENVSQESLEYIIDSLAQRSDVDGILLQMPIPQHLDPKRALAHIPAEKDVDAFLPENIGHIMRGDYGFLPCTPAGVIELLHRYGIDPDGKECVVVGRSDIVGKPMAMMLLHENGTVTICHRHTRNLGEHTRRADILVAAAGCAKMITADMVKEGAAVIDVGMNRDGEGRLCGDVDFASVEPKASYITPVPGGVGPMTVAMLMKNTVAAAEKHILKEKK